MQVITTAARLTAILNQYKTEKPSVQVGFVPTMGALHEGHIQLIKEARKSVDLVVCSIFVNPTQFNNQKDLEKYPRTIEADQLLLEDNSCDILYLPDVTDVYPNGINVQYEIKFNGLDEVMEGKFRPGHFKGVAQVVERLFQIVQPQKAFFGRKDFQQVAIIKQLVSVRNLKVQICVVDTVRNESGLALSSRNRRLTTEQQTDALIIFKTLKMIQDLAKKRIPVKDIKAMALDFFNLGKLKLEYLEIADDATLEEAADLTRPSTCCIAAFCDDVRLIDNMRLN